MSKKILCLILTLAMLFALVTSVSSCRGNNGGTGPGSGGTEEGNAPENQLDPALLLPITKDGEPVITIVSSYSKTKEYASAYNAFISYFKDAGIKVNTAYAASEDAELPEILIGDRINARGNTYLDPHSLGDEGYAIRVIGNKLVVAGGSDKSLKTALEILATGILKLGEPDTDVKNLSIPRSTDIYTRQYYPIKSITVAGKDLSGYDIVCDIYDTNFKACADSLHDVLYGNAGYWLNVKQSSTAPAIRIKAVDYAGEGGFRVYVDGYDVIIECAYPALIVSSFESFLDAIFRGDKERDIDLVGDIYDLHISSVKYSDFGAVGDGVTDDYEAIKAAHIEANRTGLTVIAESGKTYNLGQHPTPIIVKTDTIWDGATFIIDDSQFSVWSSVRTSAVFSIESSTNPSSVAGIKSLEKGQTNVGVTFKAPTLLYIVYDGIKQYIRYGNNADSGANQQEIILVDAEGNVDPSTPILWDYPAITSVAAYSASDKPITISGGKFITIANAALREYNYYARNVLIKRSNVTVDGLEHYIEGEGDTGAPYNGFIAVSYCNNVLVKNTVLTGHKVYKLSSDSTNSMGTYDISLSCANNITFLNCRQSNSITDTAYWGIMGSNYCKNLTYDGCVFSRFDAHKGTHNATIINSEIGHQKLSIIGSGTLTVENTVIHGNNIVSLRGDYGSTWDGDMIFRNVTLKNTGTATLVNASWNNHYFGYTCHLPENITIDGITLAKGTSFYVLPKLTNGIDTATVNGQTNLNPIVLTKTVTIVSNPKNYTYSVSSNTTLFASVEIIKE